MESKTNDSFPSFQRFVVLSRSALLVTCAVAVGLFPPTTAVRHSERISPASFSDVTDTGLLRRVSVNAKGRGGAPTLRISSRSAAMASTSGKLEARTAATAATKYYRQRFSLRDRVMYAASEFLMWNSMARVFALLAFGLVFIYLGSLAFARLDPEGVETNKAPFWMSARSYLNPLEDDYSTTGLRLLSVCMAMTGMVFFGIFVGMVTEAVESGIASADGGSSRVVASGHTLICGWNRNTPKIIADINAVSDTRAKFVVLVAESEKDLMMEELREALSEEQQKRISISVRSGTPVLPQDLDRVAASRANKIILSAGRGISAAESDRRVLSRALALRSNIPLFSGDVVAELSSPRDELILQSIFKSTSAKSVQAVSAERLLFRFMAQAVRQVGLADCVAELMGEDKTTVFHVLPLTTAAPNLVGMNFRDVRPTAIPGSIVAGYVDPSTGKVVIAAGGGSTSHQLTSQSELLLLGVPKSRQGKIAPLRATVKSPKEQSKVFGLHSSMGRRAVENILVCGWRPGTMPDFLAELDTVLPKGSSLTIVDDDAPDLSDKAIAARLKMKNISLSTVRKSAADFNTLELLLCGRGKSFDHVVILSSALGPDSADTVAMEISGAEEDSNALTSLCYVNELLKTRDQKNGAHTTVTVEFMNEKVADIVRKNDSAANVILPDSLTAHIIAQTVRDSRLNSVWSELVSQKGKEVYLRSASDYLKSPAGSASFADIATDAASERDEIVLGYLTRDGESFLNPSGNGRFSSRLWTADDQIVVLRD